MSKYTTEVRFICEEAAGYEKSKGYESINDIIDKAIPVIFDFDFPIFDENYRIPLLKKILKHYYTREIGAETVALWKFWLDQRLNEIMPFYNKLYDSELLKFNPLYDTDLTNDHINRFTGNTDEVSENHNTGVGNVKNITHGVGSHSEDETITDEKTGSETVNTTASSTTNEESEAWNYYHDTPQGGVVGLETLTYLTNATKDTAEKESTTDSESESASESEENAERNRNTTGSNTNDVEETTVTNNKADGSATGNTKVNNVEDYISHVIGKSSGKSYSKMVMEFRDTFLNIDMDIINNLGDLFLNLW